MAWVESHTILIRHRKLIDLAHDLRLRPVYVMGHLHALWHAALEQAEDGDLSQWSDEFIANSACYPGSAPQFVSLLQKHHWLDGKIIHDWLDYAGRYLKSKYQTSNPEKLKSIQNKHQINFSSSKDDPPNQPNLTIKPSAGEEPPVIVDKSVDNPAVKQAMDEVYRDGFNIYELVGRVKKRLRWDKARKFPDRVILKVCSQYKIAKPDIQNHWPWFVKVLEAESAAYYSAEAQKEHGQLKGRGGGLSLADILLIAKSQKGGIHADGD